MRVRNYRELLVWQKGHQLALEIYRVTVGFPKVEQFGLTDQLRRAAISVPSNVVEGYERGSNKEFKHFLSIARGSTGEVRAQIELARDIGYMQNDDFEKLFDLTTEVHKMINSLIKKLESPTS